MMEKLQTISDELETDIREYITTAPVSVTKNESEKRLVISVGAHIEVDLRDIIDWVKENQPDLLL